MGEDKLAEHDLLAEDRLGSETAELSERGSPPAARDARELARVADRANVSAADASVAEIPDAKAPDSKEPAHDPAKEPAQKPPPDQADTAKGKAAADAGEKERKKRRPMIIAIAGVVAFLLIAGGGYYWYSTADLESTDDAYTDGRAITIAPQVSGNVVSLDVTDNQFVRKGQPLIHIDPRQYNNDRDQAQGTLTTAKAQYAGQQSAALIARKNFPAQLDQAKAQVANAEAALVQAQLEYKRQTSLTNLATTQQKVEQVTAAQQQAQAQLLLARAQVEENSPVQQRIEQVDAQVIQNRGQIEQAQAQLDKANLNLDWTVVTAPQDGWITKRNVEVGNYVTPGQQIFSIVSPEVWITANFKESQLRDMRPGQKVTIEVDAYPKLKLKGHVDSVQLGSGTKFTAFPPENATGNFVKIVQRVPVKIIIDEGLDPNLPLPLGISVVPTVTVR
jgi:membrane fusion protein, multidrug efflux system